MKKILFLFLLPALLLACGSPYGERVAFTGGEIFYKGEGVSEADVQRLGTALQKTNYFKDGARTVQLTHDGKQYIVRLVVDTATLNDTLRLVFWKFQHDVAAQAFGGKPLRIALADQKLVDRERLQPIARRALGRSAVFYDPESVRPEAVDSLVSFFSATQLFTPDNGALMMYRQEKGLPVVRIAVDPTRFTLATAPAFTLIQETMRERLFGGRPAKLVLTSPQLSDLPPVPEMPAEQREQFRKRMQRGAGRAMPAADSTRP